MLPLAAATASDTSRITVRIVPSAGFVTALYAAAEASSSPAARLLGVTSVAPSTPRASPPMICERITPEFPRAPMSAPCDMAASTAPAAGSAQRSASSIVERIVRYMLVPVSPSGTGKTFTAFTWGMFRSSQTVAAANTSRSSAPEKEAMVGRVTRAPA